MVSAVQTVNLIYEVFQMSKKEMGTPAPPKAQKYMYFACVIQSDFPEQMEVFDWITTDISLTCMYIVHDRDKYDSEDLPDGVYVRKNADGTESEFRVGNFKPRHIHMIVKVSRPISASAMTKRFLSQVHFEGLSDPEAYSYYMTHDTFASRHKAHYEFSKLLGDVHLIADLRKAARSSDILQIVKDYRAALSLAHGSKSGALQRLIENGSTDCIRSIMAHSNFYDKFFEGEKNE